MTSKMGSSSDERTSTYKHSEPRVIDDNVLTQVIFDQGPQNFARKLAEEEGVDFFVVKCLRLDYKNEQDLPTKRVMSPEDEAKFHDQLKTSVVLKQVAVSGDQKPTSNPEELIAQIKEMNAAIESGKQQVIYLKCEIGKNFRLIQKKKGKKFIDFIQKDIPKETEYDLFSNGSA